MDTGWSVGWEYCLRRIFYQVEKVCCLKLIRKDRLIYGTEPAESTPYPPVNLQLVAPDD